MQNQAQFFVGWGSLSLINAGLAQAKGRSGLIWLLASLLIGPVVTLLIVVLNGLVNGVALHLENPTHFHIPPDAIKRSAPTIPPTQHFGLGPDAALGSLGSLGSVPSVAPSRRGRMASGQVRSIVIIGFGLSNRSMQCRLTMAAFSWAENCRLDRVILGASFGS